MATARSRSNADDDAPKPRRVKRAEPARPSGRAASGKARKEAAKPRPPTTPPAPSKPTLKRRASEPVATSRPARAAASSRPTTKTTRVTRSAAERPKRGARATKAAAAAGEARPEAPPAAPAAPHGTPPDPAPRREDGPVAPPLAPPVSPVPPPVPPPSVVLPSLSDEEGWIPIEADGSATSPADARGIPPLPDDDEFEPIEDGDDDEEAPREAPAGTPPHAILAGVRRGDLHPAALDALSEEEVATLGREEGLTRAEPERRAELLFRLLHHDPQVRVPDLTYETEGLLDVQADGYGFLRHPRWSYAPTPFDPYVDPQKIRQSGLQTGQWVEGVARSPRPGERHAAVVEVHDVNHEDPSVLAGIVPFDRLTVTHPDQRFVLETSSDEVAMRVMDLFCPLGRGQRALIVSPPRAGKTILLQKIADSLARNSPEVEIVVLLLDERPEEVTNMRRSVRGEVMASTFDQPPHRHIRLAELAIQKVQRMVEFGRHVVLLLDSLTRLGRAYNNESGGTGRLLTGGLEASALTKPKRFFGAARNIEHGGSLTIVATSLVDTGSRLDQVIFEEFKGTGNMEIVLSREIANQRIWPAIDVAKSGTRNEELLLHPEELRRIIALRRQMLQQEPAEALLEVLEKMAKYRTNAELLMRL